MPTECALDGLKSLRSQRTGMFIIVGEMNLWTKKWATQGLYPPEPPIIKGWYLAAQLRQALPLGAEALPEQG